ncbi:hypothetical protein SBA6_1020011 [Candidatus Sulfopaludibacter sp. SbA6]|nr:hypothetical protein SBA6_1020011 [Candidatus Sulfopaludibacter sp. SbA6]
MLSWYNPGVPGDSPAYKTFAAARFAVPNVTEGALVVAAVPAEAAPGATAGLVGPNEMP